TETRGQGIVIQGSGFFLSPTFARQKVAIVGADRAMLAGVTVKNPDAQGYGVWIESTSPAIVDSTFTESGHDGISVTGNGAPLIRNNYFYQNGANGITIYGTSQAEVRENIFEQTGFAINVNQKATPLLVGNRITQNKDGIVVQASAQPVLQNNSVDGNTRDGLVAIAQARPNLGTAAAPGGNTFRNNGQFDVNAKGSSQQIPAFGNDLDKTIGKLDLAGASLGANASGTPMPWSTASTPGSSRLVALSTGQRSPVSADKSTAGGKNVAVRTQKSIANTSQTIPFGQRLDDDRQVVNPTTQRLQRSSAPASITPTEGGISAAAFPVPTAQPSIASPRPTLPLVAVASPASVTSEPEFPVPSALSGLPTKVRSRPVQVVRVAITRPMPLQRSPQAAPASFNATLPPAVVTTRASLLPARTPIASSNLSASPTQLTPLLTQKPIALKRTGTIEIPVPAPEARSTPVRAVAVTPAIASVPSPSFTSAGLLPVPNPDAPIGNVGSASIVYRTQQSNASAALKLPYRVVVEANDSQQAQLRAAFPNAFRTSIKGRSLMQVGAFGDRGKAEQLMQTLSSQGVQAMVETVE
ncbi:MAG: DUF1565 domain-containing protein, partial [Verrucomicrobia bacterium]|nr:DUF1565 domain-containing protein [Leptolyngbya sp. ES-bin-22]